MKNNTSPKLKLTENQQKIKEKYFSFEPFSEEILTYIKLIENEIENAQLNFEQKKKKEIQIYKNQVVDSINQDFLEEICKTQLSIFI